jgi:hypothetical protein
MDRKKKDGWWRASKKKTRIAAGRKSGKKVVRVLEWRKRPGRDARCFVLTVTDRCGGQTIAALRKQGRAAPGSR